MRTATANLVLTAAVSVLREHAAGRSLDPLRLDWALTMILQNSRIGAGQIPASLARAF